MLNQKTASAVENRKPAPMSSDEAIDHLEQSLRQVDMKYDATVSVLNIFANVRQRKDSLNTEFEAQNKDKENAPSS